MYAVAKAVIEKRIGIALGDVREPLLNPSQEDARVVDEAYALVLKALEI